MKGGQFLVCLFVKLSQARYNYIGYWLAPNVQDNAGISTDWLFFQQGLGIEKYPIFDLFKHKGFQCLIGNLEIKPFGLNHLSKIAKKVSSFFSIYLSNGKVLYKFFFFFSLFFLDRGVETEYRKNSIFIKNIDMYLFKQIPNKLYIFSICLFVIHSYNSICGNTNILSLFDSQIIYLDFLFVINFNISLTKVQHLLFLHFYNM